MSFFDKAKTRAAEAAGIAKVAADKAGESIKFVAAGAAEKIEQGGYVDKAAAKIDEKTKGKYATKIDKVATGTKETMAKLVTDAEAGETGPAGETKATPQDPQFPPHVPKPQDPQGPQTPLL